jgi:hypothetical protein
LRVLGPVSEQKYNKKGIYNDLFRSAAIAGTVTFLKLLFDVQGYR